MIFLELTLYSCQIIPVIYVTLKLLVARNLIDNQEGYDEGKYMKFYHLFLPMKLLLSFFLKIL